MASRGACRPFRAAAPRGDGSACILDCHAERRADPREGIDRRPDQRAVAQAGMCWDVNAVEQRAPRRDRSAEAPASSRARPCDKQTRMQ